MKRFDIIAEEMKTKEDAEKHLKEVFGMNPDHNLTLDSLYMELMSFKEPVRIVFDDATGAVDNLGRFGLGLIKLMRDADKESDYIDFEW